MLADARKYGVRVALYGRKINHAENQLAFISFLRLIVDGVLGPVEAVKAYHAVLRKLGIPPRLSLEDDLKVTAAALQNTPRTTRVAKPAPVPAVEPKPNGFPRLGNGLPDFSKMDVSQRLAYHRERLGLGR